MADLFKSVRRILRDLGGEPEPDEVSAQLKKYADKQPVTITLSPEQLEYIKAQWQRLDPSKPAAITFEVEGKPFADFKVASCAYWGDTCCA
jgi:hypothetical protein